jgi:hypothetical protein
MIIKFNTGKSNYIIFETGIKRSSAADPVMWLAQPQITEGALEHPFSNYPSEIRSNRMTVDEDGLKCTFEDKTFASMSKLGFEVTHTSGSSSNFGPQGAYWNANNGNKGLGIYNGGIEGYDISNGEFTGFLKNPLRGVNINGLCASATSQGDYFGLGLSKALNTDSSHNISLGLSFENSDTNLGPAGVHIFSMESRERAFSYLHNHTDYYQESGHMHLNGQELRFDDGSGFDSSIFKSSSSNGLNVYGNDHLNLGVREGKNYRVLLKLLEMPNEPWVENFAHWNFKNYDMTNMQLKYSVVNKVTKQHTMDYGLKSSTNATRYLFTKGKITNGTLTLNIPNVYKGNIKEYNIASIVKFGKGDVWVETQEQDRFVIAGENDISVNIEIELIHNDAMEYRAGVLGEEPAVGKELVSVKTN